MRIHRRTTAVASVAFLAAVALLAACAGGDGDAASVAATVLAPNGEVRRVVDGDTVEVRVGGSTERVRLIGIDTPESVQPGAAVECWGPEAAETTRALLPPGTPVRLERDTEARDRFDRLLAYVYRAEDGLFVNLELARRGAADALRIEPNVAHAAAIAGAVGDARRAGLGLWGACGPPGEREG